jgi:hypothetical protein
MEDDELQFDPRTRRKRKNIEKYAEPRQKDTAKEDRIKLLFKELVQLPVYKELKAVAYALCIMPPASNGVDYAIGWHFTSVRKSAMDMLFQRIESTAMQPAAEDMPVINKTRVSFFSENDPI